MEGTSLLTWISKSHSPDDHPIDWFWTVGFIGFAIIIGSLLTDNWTFALLAFILTMTVITSARQTAKEKDATITDKGVVAGKRFFPYKALTAFSCDERHHRPTLVVYQKTGLFRHVHIPLAQPATCESVRAALAGKLKETAHTYTLSELIGERLGII